MLFRSGARVTRGDQAPDFCVSGEKAVKIADCRLQIVRGHSSLVTHHSVLRSATPDHTTICVSPALPDRALWGMIKAQLENIERVPDCPAGRYVPASVCKSGRCAARSCSVAQERLRKAGAHINIKG